ncbi:MAG: hypothetical protein C0524_05910 [Rhodobacter sp.]|nr:hypothetical protein [Rhodobacter sp.]
MFDGSLILRRHTPDTNEVTDADLDECTGYAGPTAEFPHGICHDHLTTEKAPHSVDCCHGQVDAPLTMLAGPGDPGGAPPRFRRHRQDLGCRSARPDG